MTVHALVGVRVAVRAVTLLAVIGRVARQAAAGADVGLASPRREVGRVELDPPTAIVLDPHLEVMPRRVRMRLVDHHRHRFGLGRAEDLQARALGQLANGGPRAAPRSTSPCLALRHHRSLSSVPPRQYRSKHAANVSGSYSFRAAASLIVVPGLEANGWTVASNAMFE